MPGLHSGAGLPHTRRHHDHPHHRLRLTHLPSRCCHRPCPDRRRRPGSHPHHRGWGRMGRTPIGEQWAKDHDVRGSLYRADWRPGGVYNNRAGHERNDACCSTGHRTWCWRSWTSRCPSPRAPTAWSRSPSTPGSQWSSSAPSWTAATPTTASGGWSTTPSPLATPSATARSSTAPRSCARRSSGGAPRPHTRGVKGKEETRGLTVSAVGPVDHVSRGRDTTHWRNTMFTALGETLAEIHDAAKAQAAGHLLPNDHPDYERSRKRANQHWFQLMADANDRGIVAHPNKRWVEGEATFSIAKAPHPLRFAHFAQAAAPGYAASTQYHLIQGGSPDYESMAASLWPREQKRLNVVGSDRRFWLCDAMPNAVKPSQYRWAPTSCCLVAPELRAWSRHRPSPSTRCCWRRRGRGHGWSSSASPTSTSSTWPWPCTARAPASRAPAEGAVGPHQPGRAPRLQLGGAVGRAPRPRRRARLRFAAG